MWRVYRCCLVVSAGNTTFEALMAVRWWWADWTIVPKYFLIPSHGETFIIIRQTRALCCKGTLPNSKIIDSSIWKAVVNEMRTIVATSTASVRPETVAERGLDFSLSKYRTIGLYLIVATSLQHSEVNPRSTVASLLPLVKWLNNDCCFKSQKCHCCLLL